MGSTNNTIAFNQISNNTGYGIFFDSSGGNRINNNTFENNALFFVGDFVQTEVNHNTVNNKPILYLLNIRDYIIPENTGQIIIGYSNNIIIRNQNFSISSVDPIILFDCDEITIHDNEIRDSNHGIYANDILDAKITDNQIIDAKFDGVFIDLAFDTDISNNLIQGSMTNGIYIANSVSISITNNIIKESGSYGIYLDRSPNTVVSWNDFIDSNNCLDMLDDQENGCSQGYSTHINNEIIYNYWSDWTEPDKNFNCLVDGVYSLDGSLEVDIAPLTRSIAKSSLNGNFCKVRAIASTFLKDNQIPLGILLVVFILLVVTQYIRKVRRRRKIIREDVVDIYPEEDTGIDNSV
jgi:parallel beta-helix repeat protein